MAWAVDGLASKPYPRGRGQTGVGSTSVVCKYEDAFSDELPGLPLQRDVDFTIEFHLSSLPISMAPHRMAPAEL